MTNGPVDIVQLPTTDWERLLEIAHFTFSEQDERILNTIQTAITKTAEQTPKAQPDHGPGEPSDGLGEVWRAGYLAGMAATLNNVRDETQAGESNG